MPRSDFSDLVKNPKMKLVLQDCGHLDSATLGRGYTLQVGVYKHCCTSGPSTWYRKAGINLKWWSSAKTATVEEMKRNLQSAGLVQVWSGTGQEANEKLNSSKYLRPGDIGSMLSSDSAHGVMWTGEDWRSDCIQGTRPYPYSSSGRGGNQTFILWRHPALQEPGLSVQGDGLGNSMADGMSSGFGGGSHNWPDFNFQSFPIMNDENGQYTNEPLLLGIANHLRMYGGSGVSGAVGDTFGGGVFAPGSLPIPSGFYPDNVLHYFISHAEGNIAVMWTSGKNSRTPVVGEGCGGYDFPGGVHNKSLLPPGYTIEQLGVSWTNSGRQTMWSEGKSSGARWGWYSTPITPEHNYWKALMPVYRDAMIWAWHNVQGLMSIKEPAKRLCEMHICNWGFYHNTTLKGTSVFGYKHRYEVASKACQGMSNFP